MPTMASDNVVNGPASEVATAGQGRTPSTRPAHAVKPARRSPRSAARGLLSKHHENWSLAGPSPTLQRRQKRLWDFLNDHYFRLDMGGWEHLPDKASLLIGIHSGTSLTMDAWTLTYEWWRRFEGRRILHATAHDVLMSLPGLGAYFRASGVIPASAKSVGAALEAQHDVIIWPGGEVDSMRSWRKRDQVVLAGRKGFVKQAIRSGVSIVPVATVGGADTVFVLSEGRTIARMIHAKQLLRSEVFPIVLGIPFGVWPEVLPSHIPLPAKIRTTLMEPIDVDHDPERAQDHEYVDAIYREVERRIQAGVDRLAKRRCFPIFG